MNDKEVSTKGAPPIPTDWTRCHSYIERKHRFCRQVKLPKSHYCGYHHVHMNKEAFESGGINNTKRRIPCPLDPSHDILEDQIEKHKKICPKVMQEKEQQTRRYYRHNVNLGGHGEIGIVSESESCGKPPGTIDWALHIAAKVLEIHNRLFPTSDAMPSNTHLSQPINSSSLLTTMTDKLIHDAIPMLDLSQPELNWGLPHAIEHFRIKSGGERHLHQQASLLGHLRRIGALPPHPKTKISTASSKETTSTAVNAPDVEFIEMGAGRGMFGLLAAGVAASYGASRVRLVLVERSGARSKADTVLRKAKEATSYMKLHTVEWSRIQCDLAHIHFPSILHGYTGGDCIDDDRVGHKRKERTHSKKLVVVAKHLCGAGTDLALKSLVGLHVDSCLLATCCHGLCTWEAYVGRTFLIQEFADTHFGSSEFELLRKWSAGTVANSECKHDKQAKLDDSDPCSVSAVVRALNLNCGIKGLGRACQRLLDWGRCDYMQKILFPGTHHVEICHYVDANVTPQNAILVARHQLVAT